MYERHGALVHSIARRVLRDPQAQEECTHDVFVQVWRQADRYDAARGSVGGWLVQITRSRAIEFARRAERRDIPFETVEPGGVEPGHDAQVAILDEAVAVARALTHLPREQYDAIRLAYFDGLAQTEIAERLELPLGTVKGRIRLALERLRAVAPDYALGTEP